MTSAWENSGTCRHPISLRNRQFNLSEPVEYSDRLPGQEYWCAVTAVLCCWGRRSTADNDVAALRRALEKDKTGSFIASPQSNAVARGVTFGRCVGRLAALDQRHR